MKPRSTLVLLLILLLAACGGDSGGSASDTDSGDSGTTTSDASGSAETDSANGGSGGDVVDAPPAGQAFASVDGQEFTFDLPGGLPCEVSEDEFNFSFRIGDNEVVVGGGATRLNDEWFGSITLSIFADNDVTEYSANVVDNPSAVAVDGASASYSGPMQKIAPTDDGSAREPEDVGNGTISFTCS